MDEEGNQLNEETQSVAEPNVNRAAPYFGGKIGSKIVSKIARTGVGRQMLGAIGMNNMNEEAADSSEDSLEDSDSIEPSQTGGGVTPPPNGPSDDSDSDDDGGDNNNKKGPFGKFTGKWKDMSIRQKITILSILGGVAFVIMIIGVVAAISPFNFLDFSNDLGESQNFSEEYEEYWNEFCESEEDGCTPEQVEAASELKESQMRFYEKFEKLTKKLTKKQKYLVLTTIFFGYDIDDFTEGNNAFELDEDETGEIDYDPNNSVQEVNGTMIYEREKDTIKELVKQFKISTPVCIFDQLLENGETASDKTEPLYDENNNIFVFNFFDKVSVIFGGNPQKGYLNAKNDCLKKLNAKIEIVDTTDTEISIEGFYNYLKTTDYLDIRPQLDSYYIEYAKDNKLPMDKNSWAIEDKIIVREMIIKDIKDIVDEYDEEEGPEFSTPTGTEYWWPIGSIDTTEDGKFAKGDPQYTKITDDYGWREAHPVSGERKFHGGIDIRGDLGETNVIASLGGVVININNTCVSVSDMNKKRDVKCGGGYGNFVEIQDTKGNINLYAHLYRDSITVEKGDTVSQGQVIGKVGSSGSSTGPHLHFTIKVNGKSANPLEYVDIADPRPSGTIDYFKTSYTREEFSSRLKEYYSNKNCTRTGCVPFKTQIVDYDGAEVIYDIAASYNLNPELIIGRVENEGYSPGIAYNYFGYGCTNTGGLSACFRFSSFKAGIEEFFKYISQFDSVENMMSNYAYLGDYWYTGVHWDMGGCAYATYIYPDGVPDRITEACNHPDGYCSKDNTANCVATLQEDKEAYTRWQVKKMASVIKGIFR